MKVWLTRHESKSKPRGIVAWIEVNDNLLVTLMTDGKYITYDDHKHNEFVKRLLEENTNDWERL